VVHDDASVGQADAAADAEPRPDASAPDASPATNDALVAANDATVAPPSDAGVPVSGALAFDVPDDWTALPQGYVLTADVDGDGRRDAVSIDGYNPVGQNHITFAIQQANRTFMPASTFTTPGNPGVLLSYADFDGDGNTDVAVNLRSASLPNLYIATGDGSGNFGAPRAIMFEGSVFGDFNGDSRADIIDPYDSGDSYLYLSEPAGTYRSTRIAVRASAIDVGDFDGDGTLDLAAGTTVHRGLGAGAFGPGLPATCAACGALDRVRVARMNGDRRDDLVVANDTSITILVGQANGSLEQASTHAVVRPQSLATGDIDGDGRTDLVAVTQPIPVTSDDGLELFFGDGAGGFAERVLHQNTRAGYFEAIIVDADGDTRNDVILEGRWIASNLGGRRIKAPVLSPYRATAGGRQLVDFDGDSRVDMVLPASNGALTVIPFGADHRLGAPVTCASPAPTEYQAISDITGDGKVDVRAIAMGTLTVWVGGGGCMFGPAQRTTGDIFSGEFVDLNGDHLQDLVHTPTGQISVLLSSAPGAFAAPVLTPFTGFASAIAPADFTGDGVADLVIVDDRSAVTVWRGDAMHRFTTIQTIAAMPNDTIWYASAVDADGDGDVDLLFASSSMLEMFDNDGRGNLTRRALGTVHSVVQITTADLDADGSLEIIAADNQQSTSIFSVAPGGPAVRRMRLGLPRGAFPYDVDGDGDVDLIYNATNGGSGLVAVANNRTRD